MSGLEVVGAISAVIGILDASIKIYESVKKDAKLDEAFQTVGRRLPIILNTLQTCKEYLDPIKGSLAADVWEALEKIVDACDEKAGRLREIFEKSLPGDNEGWQKRYMKVFRRLGKGNKVEELMLSITEDVQLLVNHHAVQSAKPEQQAELNAIIQEMNSVPSSVPEEECSGYSFHSGGGAQTNNVNSGPGQQINNNAAVGTQYFNSVTKPREDFSFRGPKGVCLGQAPYTDPALFVGRDDEMKKMQDALKPRDETWKQQRLVLGGMGGVGKTQLAIAYAKQHEKDYHSIFWLNAASEAATRESLCAIATTVFQVHDLTVLEGEEGITRARGWLSDPRNTRWLLIVDNYDDPDEFSIESYYPAAMHGTIIVTTRRPDQISGTVIRVQPMSSIADSLAILQSRSGRKDVENDPGAKQLAKRLAGLPLALATAGAYLRHSSITFQRYLEEYERQWNINPQRPTKLQEYQDRSLYTTWGLSYTRLEAENPDVAKLLKLLAYFNHQNVSHQLLRAGLNDTSAQWMHALIDSDIWFDGAMATLIDYCLVEVQTVPHSWSIHTCVHDWALAVLNDNLDFQGYWYAFDCVAALVARCDQEKLGYARFGYLAGHGARLVKERFSKVSGTSPIDTGRLGDAGRIANLLRQQVHLVAAEKMYEQALTGYEKALGPDHTSTLDTVNNLGVLYYEQGYLRNAEKMYQRALVGREKALGVDHTSTVGTVICLGILYSQRGRLGDAETMYNRALAVDEKALGPDHTTTLMAVHNLGLLYRDQGRLSDAEKMFDRALRGEERALGPDHVSTLGIIHNLGLVYRDQERLNDAEGMYTRALAGYEKTLGPDHVSTLGTVSSLASLYSHQGQVSGPKKMYERVLAGYEKALGPDHTSTLMTVYNLGILYRNQGQLSYAEMMLTRALTGYEKALGPDHTSTLGTVNTLGTLYHDQGRLSDAEKMYNRALIGREKALGLDHASTLDTINGLGSLYRAQGRLSNAEKMYNQALVGREKALGPDHTLTSDTVNCLGSLYQGQGRLSDAEKMYHRALMGREKALGPDHTSTLDIVNCLGSLYHAQGRLSDAEKMYNQALTGREKALGPDHTSTLYTVNCLGSLYRAQGQLSDAEKMFNQALAGYEKALGPGHTSTLDTVHNLGILYVQCGNLVNMITLVSQWGSRKVSLFDYLGRLLLQFSDDVNAQRSFQYASTVYPGVTVHMNIFCDICKRLLSTETGRTVCRQCADKDLCQECFYKHPSGGRGHLKCRGHDFFEVSLESTYCPGLHFIAEALEKAFWLQQLTLLYVEEN